MGEQVTLTLDVLYDILRRERNNAQLQELPAEFINLFVSYLNEKVLFSNKLRERNDTAQLDQAFTQIRSIKRVFNHLLDKRESKILSLAHMKAKNPALLIDDTVFLEHEANMFNGLLSTLNVSLTKREQIFSAAPKLVPKPAAPANKTSSTASFSKEQTEEKHTNAATSVSASNATAPTAQTASQQDTKKVAEANKQQEPKPISAKQESSLIQPSKEEKNAEENVLVHFVLDLEAFKVNTHSYGPFTKDEIALVPNDVANQLVGQGHAKILES